MIKLNLGCGNDYLLGYKNVDRGSCLCDVSHDLNNVPWPFIDSSVDEIIMKHMFEHFKKDDFFIIVSEIFRVSKGGCKVHIISPYYTSNNFWTDPTHSLPLTERTFDFFDRRKALFENGKIYGWDGVNFLVDYRLVENKPNGPDIEFNLTVIKP